jgi:hypothetical protein
LCARFRNDAAVDCDVFDPIVVLVFFFLLHEVGVVFLVVLINIHLHNRRRLALLPVVPLVRVVVR